MVAVRKIDIWHSDMCGLAGEMVEIGGKDGHQCLAFTRSHFNDVALVQGKAPHQLRIKGTKAKRPPSGFAPNGEGAGLRIL